MISGADTPIRASPFLMIIRMADTRKSLAVDNPASSLTT